jgi:hypothetical protein
MQQYAGSCGPDQLHVLENTLDRLAVSVISLTIAGLCAVMLIGPGVKAVDVAQAQSPLGTVIYKNLLPPSIRELSARAALTEHKGEAKSDERLVFERHGQWI